MDLGTEVVVVDTGEVSFNNTNLMPKNTYVCLLLRTSDCIWYSIPTQILKAKAKSFRSIFIALGLKGL